MLQSIETENLLSRVCELLSYDSSAPLIFNSGLFLYLFVGFLSIYLLLRERTSARILYVIAFSLYFYYKSSGLYFILLLLVSVCDYWIGFAISASKDRVARKQLVALSALINSGLLAYFKYTNFFIE